MASGTWEVEVRLRRLRGREARRAVARGRERGRLSRRKPAGDKGPGERRAGLGTVGPAWTWGKAVPSGARLGAVGAGPGRMRG